MELMVSSAVVVVVVELVAWADEAEGLQRR